MWWARSPWVMLVLRTMQGVFSGFVPPSLTLASLQAPPERLGYVTSRIQSAVPAGAVAGFYLGGLIQDQGSMRLIFPICAGLAALGCVIVLLWVREAETPTAGGGRSIRAIGAAVAADYRYAFALPALLRFLALAVLATTLSLVVIFVPVAFMGGIVGRFFSSFGFTVAFAVLMSLFVSFTLTPMLCSRFLKLDHHRSGTAASKSGWIYRATETSFGWLLRRALRHRWITVGVAILVSLVLGLWNGALVAVIGIQPIIATLILMVAGRGVAQLITDGQIINVQSSPYATMASGFFLALPVAFLIAAAAVALITLLTRRTALGLLLKSVGGSPTASRLAGIGARRITIMVYVVSGGFAGLEPGVTAAGSASRQRASRSRVFQVTMMMDRSRVGRRALTVEPAESCSVGSPPSPHSSPCLGFPPWRVMMLKTAPCTFPYSAEAPSCSTSTSSSTSVFNHGELLISLPS